MAKRPVISLPFVVLSWDYWPLRRMFSTGERFDSGPARAEIPAKSISFLVKEKLILFAMCVVSAVVTIAAQPRWCDE